MEGYVLIVIEVHRLKKNQPVGHGFDEKRPALRDGHLSRSLRRVVNGKDVVTVNSYC